MRSLPRASRDSKSGGPTERPVTATRTGPCALLSCAWPSAFTSPAVTAAASIAARIASASHRSQRLEAGQRRVEHLGRRLALDHRLRPGVVVDLDRLVEQEGDHRLDLGEHAHALLHQRGDGGEGVEGGLDRG